MIYFSWIIQYEASLEASIKIGVDNKQTEDVF